MLMDISNLISTCMSGHQRHDDKTNIRVSSKYKKHPGIMVNVLDVSTIMVNVLGVSTIMVKVLGGFNYFQLFN